MNSAPVQLSIRSLFLWAVMTVTAVALIVPACYSVFYQIAFYEKSLRNEIITTAEFIAASVSKDLDAPDAQNAKYAINRKLKALSASSSILNAHVYRQINAFEVEQISNYTREGETQTASHSQTITNYFQPMLSDNTIEVSRAVVSDRGTTAGYVFIQSTLAPFKTSIRKLVIRHVMITVIMLLISYLVAWKLQSVLTTPIRNLGEFLNRTSRQRDYASRAQATKFSELNILSDAINVMLSRIQEYMQRQKLAEEQLRKLNSSLEDIVNQRTLALRDANQELIQTLEKLHQFQRQMVQNEKMASLGDMVAGVAHEVNTPIGLGVTASTMMLDKLAIIQKEFESKTLKASTMSRFIRESQENLNIIYRNLNRAAELISSFKQVAVDQSSENNRTFCVEQLVNEILLSLRPRLKKLNHVINVSCDPTLVVESKAGPINQILINLIMNSVIHGFEGIDSGEIDIVAELLPPAKLKLIYKDNGKGIPRDIRKRIFDPFVTTKRGQGGSGLGMHLVYNLVTQALNGTITITSEEQNGVEFIIIFPVERAESGKLPLKSE